MFRRVLVKIKTKCREIHLRAETKSKYIGRIQNCNILIPRQEAASAVKSCPFVSWALLVYFSPKTAYIMLPLTILV